MLSHVCLKSTKKVIGWGKHNWLGANMPEYESIGPLYLSDQNTQNVHLLYLVIYCCIEFVTDISKYITCVIGQVYRFRPQLKVCKYVCAGGIFGIISQIRSPVPFSRVSYIYDHLAHWGNPLTSTRIAPTHAFWWTSLAENKNHGIKKEFGEPC